MCILMRNRRAQATPQISIMNFLLCDIPYLVQAPPLCSSAYVATSKEAGKLINVRRGFKLTDRNFADEVSYFPNAFPHAPGASLSMRAGLGQ